MTKVLNCSLLFAGLVMVLSLSSCGKIGKPEQPGPASKITYPHSYPME